MRVGEFCRFDYLFPRCSRPAVTDVLDDRSREKIHILLHDTDMVTKALEPDVTYVLAVYPDRSSGNVVEPRDQAAERRLAAARRADQRYIGTRLDVKVDVTQYPVRALFVLKRHVVKNDVAFDVSHVNRAFPVLYVRLDIEDLGEPFKSRIAVLELLREVDDNPYRFCEYVDVQKERDEVRNVDKML